MQRKTDGNKQTVTEQSTKTDRWKLVDMRRQTETDSEGRDRQRRTVTERKTDKQTETDGMICCTIQYIFTGCCGLCTEACIYQVILFLYVGNNSNMERSHTVKKKSIFLLFQGGVADVHTVFQCET